jgi:hypothetical protein
VRSRQVARGGPCTSRTTSASNTRPGTLMIRPDVIPGCGSIVPKVHRASAFDLTAEEWAATRLSASRTSRAIQATRSRRLHGRLERSRRAPPPREAHGRIMKPATGGIRGRWWRDGGSAARRVPGTGRARGRVTTCTSGAGVAARWSHRLVAQSQAARSLVRSGQSTTARGWRSPARPGSARPAETGSGRRLDVATGVWFNLGLSCWPGWRSREEGARPTLGRPVSSSAALSGLLRGAPGSAHRPEASFRRRH